MRKTVMGFVGVVVLVMASASTAQMKPMAPEGSQSPAPGTTQAPMQSSQMPVMRPEMGHPMMGGMMREMMSTSDPKTQARMLRFHGDIMKAMSARAVT